MEHVIMPSADWRFGKSFFYSGRGDQNLQNIINVQELVPDKKGILPQNGFVVSLTQGSPSLVKGQDNTNDCLLFTGEAIDCGSGVEIYQRATSGQVIGLCSCGNLHQVCVDVAVVLKAGQTIAFLMYGKYSSDLVIHTWTGKQMETSRIPLLAWERQKMRQLSASDISWLPGNYVSSRLCGNQIDDGIIFEDGLIARPTAHGPAVLASGYNVSDQGRTQLSVVRLGLDQKNGLVIAPGQDGEPLERESCLVLVQEYCTIKGRRAFPSFHIDWSDVGVVKMVARLDCSNMHSASGGGDVYTIAIAPRDWAENIAAQFIDRCGYPDQIIGYRPSMDIDEIMNINLLNVLRGDEERRRQFKANVLALSRYKLDNQLIVGGGHEVVANYIRRVSGNDYFFVGVSATAVMLSYIRRQLITLGSCQSLAEIKPRAPTVSETTKLFGGNVSIGRRRLKA